jgi:hypothetical protein
MHRLPSSVACYNLQHPAQFRDEALAGLRTALVDRVDHATPVEEIRRRFARAHAGERRVLRAPSQRQPVRRRWGTTIADVYGPGSPHGAAARVRAWAATIRETL